MKYKYADKLIMEQLIMGILVFNLSISNSTSAVLVLGHTAVLKWVIQMRLIGSKKISVTRFPALN